ncbi:MAG: hypothetical protein V3R49_05520 [Gammaproteobacteria bacterium]
MNDEHQVDCEEHGKSEATFICNHLLKRENSDWYSGEPLEDDPYPDTWCGLCHIHYEKEGEWNEVSETAADASNSIKILCAECYERLKSECNVHIVD